MPGMMPDEVLAVCRLRQWAADRTAMRAARTTDYSRNGWRERRARDVDARLVRVIDFERALTRLPDEQQAILLLTYREHQPQSTIAQVTGCSVRALAYKLPAARQALARTLDLLNLL
jgi:DNA-directed RNA polymerase specialized sigma24 family protein